MAIYVKYTSPGITGGVTTKGFEGQFEIDSFQFGLGRSVGSPTGGSSNREASTPNVSEIVVTKKLDEASGDILKESFKGAGKATAVISFVRTDGAGGVAYLVYTLSNVMISSWNTSSGGDRPVESLSFNFTKVEIKDTPQKDDGTAGTPSTVTYDLAAQTLT